eukprot:7423725-Prorocentrum_lima.AAC.1
MTRHDVLKQHINSEIWGWNFDEGASEHAADLTADLTASCASSASELSTLKKNGGANQRADQLVN